MTVLYSIGSAFAGGGIGTTAYYNARGLYRYGTLRRVLCGSYRFTDIPSSLIKAVGLPDRVLRKLATYDASGRLWHLQSLLFDSWASQHLEPAEVFLCWGNYGLRSLRQARAMGMTTVLQRASAHPSVQAQLLKDEYARWGIHWSAPRATLARALAEIAEADYILIPSDFVQETFVAKRVSNNRLIQIPFGVDLHRFRPAAPQPPRPFRVLFVGQVSLRKGVPYLLQAWQQLGWQDAELELAGKIDREVHEVIRPYIGLTNVRLPGHVANPLSLYQDADVFAFPTIEEGSALVIYEALASGLPVITTPNAGSVVCDGVEGLLVPIRDSQALASALERLRANERLRREMGQAARQRAEEYTWEKHGLALAERCESLAHRR